MIELSFEEARRMGHNYVGTEHLLLGIMLERDGIAAHVLTDLGVTLANVRHEIERQLAAAPPPEPDLRPASAARTKSKHELASAAPAGGGSDLERLQVLLIKAPIAQLLRARGLDVETLAEQLRNPPELVLNLRRHLDGLNHELARAVEGEQYDRAARVQKARGEMAARLRKAEQQWLEELGG